MIRKMFEGVAVATLLLLVLSVSAFGRMASETQGVKNLRMNFSAAAPMHCLVAHRVGMIELGVANNGTFGKENTPAPYDFFTGQAVPNCDYPKGSDVMYLYSGAFWVGAIVGRDTLVSVGADGWQRTQEMFPDEYPFGAMQYRSLKDPTKPEFVNAISEEDYIAVYTDTFTDDVDADIISGRPHQPLNIEITQASYAWSYSYAEDFVLFDYQIRNVGSRTLEKVYMGIYVDADVCFDCDNSNGFRDDICGFLHSYPAEYGGCTYIDTVFTAWIADNDGDFDHIHNDGSTHPCPHVTATRIVRTPNKDLEVSFNWWIGNGNASLDFGPRQRAGVGLYKEEEARVYGTGGTGTPEGDGNKYYVLRNREFDYDQIYTGLIQPNDTLWQYPNQSLASDFSDGYDTRYLLSFGPFEIKVDQTLPISFAYVGGMNLHTDADNINNLPGDPDAFYENLDFSDLALNSSWASKVYDNPGVDTDDDGYSGKYRICCIDSSILSIDTFYDPFEVDTIWELLCDTIPYEGDGVPDFRGASPPPAPDFWIDQSVGSLKIRFNGTRSETTEDVFSFEVDFEGYKVYIARDDRAASYSVISSYDRENYNKWIYNQGLGEFELKDIPFTLEELRCLYGDSCNDTNFDPLVYTRTNTYPGASDSEFYFVAQSFNASTPGVNTAIHKLYPDQPYPTSLVPQEAQPDELTEDGYLKYFEYELLIDNLLPTVPYWINVTAFDYGSPESGLESLETAVTMGAKMSYPLSSWDEIQASDLEVFVYPNPYRIDAGYRERGFEGRTDSNRPPDRTRELHFANIPPECTIKIFTIDGDLVREIAHNDGTTHVTWNLITRNTQMIVSGLYYWSVEAKDGSVQIGKLVVIM